MTTDSEPSRTEILFTLHAPSFSAWPHANSIRLFAIDNSCTGYTILYQFTCKIPPRLIQAEIFCSSNLIPYDNRRKKQLYSRISFENASFVSNIYFLHASAPWFIHHNQADVGSYHDMPITDTHVNKVRSRRSQGMTCHGL